MLFLFVTFCSSLQKVCIGNLNCPSDYTPDFDLTTVTSPDDYNIFICDLPYDIYLNASCFIANTMLNIYSDTGHANFVYFYVYSSIELTSFSIKNSHFYFVNEDYTKEYTITIHEDTSIEKSELGVHGYFEFDFNSLYFDFCSKPKSTVGYQLGYFNSLKILCDSDDLGLCSTFYTHFMLVAKTDDDSFDSELNILYTDDNQINTELGTNNDYREIRFSMYNNYQFNILINEEVNYNIIFNPHTPDDKALIRYDNLLKRYPNIKALFNLTSGSELSIDDIYSTISPHGYYKLNFIYYLEQIKEIIVPSEGLDLYLYAGISYYISYYFDKFIFEENSVLNLSTHFNSMDSFSIYI